MNHPTSLMTKPPNNLGSLQEHFKLATYFEVFLEAVIKIKGLSVNVTMKGKGEESYGQKGTKELSMTKRKGMAKYSQMRDVISERPKDSKAWHLKREK